MQDENPYAAPAAPVDDIAHAASEGALIEGGRTVPSRNSWRWIVGGFNLYRHSPGAWTLVMIIAFLMVVFGLVLPLGQLALVLLYPVFIAGLMLGCHAQARGEPFEVAYLFAGFKNRFGQLVLLGLLLMLGAIAAVMVGSLISGIGLFAAVAMSVSGALALAPLTLLLFFLVLLALLIPLQLAMWFAPALVVFHGVAPAEAMKQSFVGSLKNIVTFFVYSIIVMGLAFVASIPVFVGWLVLAPTLVGSMYYSYRDIFLNDE
jgi:uncharacterized membrane protein